jgi:hypothetical protein
MLRVANLIVHSCIDEGDDGSAYVRALMVRSDRHLLAQTKTVLPPQGQRAAPREHGRIAAGALSDLAQNSSIAQVQPCPGRGQTGPDRLVHRRWNGQRSSVVAPEGYR